MLPLHHMRFYADCSEDFRSFIIIFGGRLGSTGVNVLFVVLSHARLKGNHYAELLIIKHTIISGRAASRSLQVEKGRRYKGFEP